MKVKVIVLGRSYTVNENLNQDSTVADVISGLQIDSSLTCRLNGNPIPREDFDSRVVSDCDTYVFTQASLKHGR